MAITSRVGGNRAKVVYIELADALLGDALGSLADEASGIPELGKESAATSSEVSGQLKHVGVWLQYVRQMAEDDL